ncbi:hypothetical protein, partial [Roseateles sp. P5_E11]
MLLGLFWIFRAPAVARLHDVDQRWLHEFVTDALSRWRADEDWARAEPIARSPDYRWLHVGAEPLRIAHALGEAGTPGANTLTALQRSLALGFRHLEVDLWLEGDRVRCHHGPPGPPAYQPGDCDLVSLLGALPADAWLVLDIKTDFVRTGERALDIADSLKRTRQFIFQLYEPEHSAQFNRWQTRYADLPGPLVTAYRAHRAVDHVALHTGRIGVSVLTLPLERTRAY